MQPRLEKLLTQGLERYSLSSFFGLCRQKDMAEGDIADAFSKKMDDVMNYTALGHAISLGSRLGIFKVMIDFKEPKSSVDIAQAAGLNERYVREWLAILVTSEVFTMNKEDNTYFLPRERVPYFTDPSIGLICEEFSVMFPQIVPQLEECFRKGGGIPYSSYEGFHQVMNDMSTQGHNLNLLQNHIPSIEGLSDRLEAGIKCLDVGCGMGAPSLILGEKYPRSEFYGFDFEEEAIKTAERKANEKGLQNTHFKIKDCAVFDSEYTEVFDYISAHDAIHDQAYPADALSAVFRMLKPGGIFSMIDVYAHSNPADNIGLPKATLKYAISLFHCMPVSLFFKDGAGLGTCWGQELAVKMLKDAGFKDIKIERYHGDFNVHYVSKK